MENNPATEKNEYKKVKSDGILFYDTIDSTNEEAKRLIRANKLDEGVLIAEYQTSGKGTQGRKWVSQSGTSILMTIVKKTDKSIQEIQGITVKVGQIVYDVLLASLLEGGIAIKPPNDILLNGKKLCGILTETIKHNEQLYLIIGIGINVNTYDFETIEGNTPTSLFLETGKIYSRKELVEKIIKGIDRLPL